MAKKPKPEGKKYSYMDTYGDLVTLLLCFFVLLFAMSTVQETKYNAFVEALAARLGPDVADIVIVPAGPSDGQMDPGSVPAGSVADSASMPQDETLPTELSQMSEAIQKFIEENGMEGEVSVEVGESGATFLRLSNNLLFDGDSSVLRQETLHFLDFLSQCLKRVEGDILQVQLNGHTAFVPGSGTDDWVLSAERAGKVTSYLENIGGFDRFKLYFSGYGRNYPVADNATIEGRAQNRRVDIIILSNNPNVLEMTLRDAMRVYFPDDDTSFFEGDLSELPENAVAAISPAAALEGALSGLTDEELQQMLDELADEADNTGSTPPASTPSSTAAVRRRV